MRRETRDTKEEILRVALHLFARDGYEAVSVSQIAGALGMTKGALYRHYENKRDIFLNIVRRMKAGDAEQAEECEMPEGTLEEMPDEYGKVKLEDFARYSKEMFAYWTEDDFASSFRKMLVLEQFRSTEMQGLYQQYLVAGPVGYVRDLFKQMGILRAEEEALRFYSLMFFFYSLYDGAGDQSARENVTQRFASEVEKFVEKKGKDNGKDKKDGRKDFEK
ncbi:TetR/AcrR family transcriptional regulator [Brotaphodocola sp.]|uniref:TetR/AcrR family transcriptional regulator n=1 Tax=Brotaphodocola sp. TaxID=3073577 RepID=UPI003D7D44CC